MYVCMYVCMYVTEWKMWFSCFLVLLGTGSAEAQVIWCGSVKSLLIDYFIGNISAKKYENPFMCVKVIASQRWDFFETRCSSENDVRDTKAYHSSFMKFWRFTAISQLRSVIRRFA